MIRDSGHEPNGAPIALRGIGALFGVPFQTLKRRYGDDCGRTPRTAQWRGHHRLPAAGHVPTLRNHLGGATAPREAPSNRTSGMASLLAGVVVIGRPAHRAIAGYAAACRVRIYPGLRVDMRVIRSPSRPTRSA